MPCFSDLALVVRMSQLRVTSPALSTSSNATASLSTADSSISTSTASNNNNFAGLNYAELFQDIDWNEVNLIKLESDWRSELEQIERVILGLTKNSLLKIVFRKMCKPSWIVQARLKLSFQLCSKSLKK